MKDIVIKTSKNCEFLATEAVAKAMFYQANVAVDNPGFGKSKGATYSKYSTNGDSRWDFLVYETKKAIVVEITYHKVK